MVELTLDFCQPPVLCRRLLRKHAHRRESLSGRAVTELSEVVLSPTVDLVVGRHSAREILTRSDLRDVERAGDRGRCVAFHGATVAQLSAVVRTPAERG